jgi:hypothetical protein
MTPHGPRPKTMTRSTKKARSYDDRVKFRLVQQYAIFLIKTLCFENDATVAVLTQSLTHYGKVTGRYRITIEKL